MATFDKEFSVTVSSIRRNDAGEYSWTVTDYAESFETGQYERRTTDYRTSRDGEGLWVWGRQVGTWTQHADGTTTPIYEWKQIRGTAQFDLTGVSAGTRRERVLEVSVPGVALDWARSEGHVSARMAYAGLPRA